MTNRPFQNSVSLSSRIERAIALHRDGDIENAGEMYRQILRDFPDNAPVSHLLGGLELQQGRLESSISLIDQSVRAEPQNPFYRNSLGEAHRMHGQLGKAEQSYRVALELLPNYAQAMGNLGIVLHAGGQTEEAISLFQQAIDCEPHNWDLHNNLGVSHQALGDMTAARSCFERTIELQPLHAEAFHNLCSVYKQEGNLNEAKRAAQQCLKIAPDMAQAHWNLADVDMELGNYDEAEIRCRRAIELDSDNANYHHGLANIVRVLGRVEESIAHNRRAITIEPEFVQAYNDMAVSELAMGEVDCAIASLNKALEFAPDYPLIYENLAKCKKFSNADEAFIEKIKLLTARLDDEQASGLFFTLGKIHDDLGDFSSAFEYYLKGNSAKRATFEYDPNHQDDWTIRLLRVFNSSLIERLSAAGHGSVTPIFVLGMPRSGTSLVEQILASHVDVFGAGELTSFYEFTQQLPQRLASDDAYPECSASMGAKEVEWMGESYLSAVNALAPTARHVVDKMPMNFLHLGLIASTFPNAKIVLCERDPRDTCLSIFFQNFAARNYFAYDLYEIGRFYRQFLWTINHWCSLFPNRIIRIRYEDLIGGQEKFSRQLIDSCGLVWDDKCLDFHRTKRAVQTASAWQVRQPIHSGSVERWRFYESHLEALLAGVEGKPRPEVSIAS